MGSWLFVSSLILQQIGTFNIARRFVKEINIFSMKIIIAAFSLFFLYINEANPQIALINQDIKIQICSTIFFPQFANYFSLYLKLFLIQININ